MKFQKVSSSIKIFGGRNTRHHNNMFIVNVVYLFLQENKFSFL